jgi:nickel/cobalt transporter (NicO) family protein
MRHVGTLLASAHGGRSQLARRLASAGLLLGAAAGIVTLTAAPAQAHPLGNFTVNHYDGLTLFPDRLELSAVLDRAEIPSLQLRDTIDTDHDGSLDAAELAAAAGTDCARLAAAISVRVDDSPVSLTADRSGLQLQPGAAGLPTSRLTCALAAPAHLDRHTRLTIDDEMDGDRIGWHEITAVGRGVHIEQSPVPQQSVSAELRHYPNDLLGFPLNVRSATLDVAPGGGPGSAAAFTIPAAGFTERLVARVTGVFDGLVGSRHLTFGVGLAAVLLSLVLGASHAALPGHGKTVMAAYLAGKHGTVRDAMTVGATVTFTHTAGVLALGLLVSVSTSVAGESVVGWLGALSGLLIAGIGAGLLRSAFGGLRHGHADGHPHDLGDHGHGHDHSHDHDHRGHHTHTHDREHRDHQHRHPDGHRQEHRARNRYSRRALVGMGMAGGLVPSPSALVVLLGAVALGRTAFGVTLVLGYGVGMAAMLTAAGLLLVKLGNTGGRALRTWRWGGRLSAYTPAGTALLVLIVGIGLAARSLAALS